MFAQLNIKKQKWLQKGEFSWKTAKRTKKNTENSWNYQILIDKKVWISRIAKKSEQLKQNKQKITVK